MRDMILIIDDSPTVLLHTAALLRNAGYLVETSDSIWIADKIQDMRPTLILVDVQMGPGQGSGDTLVKSFKKLRTVESEVILYSSMPELELRALAESCGADGYITKGLDPDTFLDRIRTMMVE